MTSPADSRPGGPHRDAEFIAWLAGTARSHNQFSSGELRLGMEAWEAARGQGAPAAAAVPVPAAPMTEEAWKARTGRVLQLCIGLLDPELCERTARFLIREAWLITGKPALDDRHVLLIAKAIATETDRPEAASRMQFADLDWQERWNDATAVASLSQSGPDVMAAGLFGVLRFRLDRPADTAAIVTGFRQFTDMVAEAVRQYEAGGQYIAQCAEEHELLQRWQELGLRRPPHDYSIGSAHWPGLAKVSEECSEVVQAAMKLVAMGGDDELHWDGQGTMVTRLEDELADTRAAITFLLEANPALDQRRIAERGAAKLAMFRRWHAEHADHSAGSPS